MGQLQVDLVKFERIYTEPSIARLQHEFEDHEFEHFVGYVFEQAGFFRSRMPQVSSARDLI